MANNSLISLDTVSKEYLLASLSGAYSHSTISGCHSKKEHGLFICCVPFFNHQAYVLLSSLNESLSYEGKDINLGNHPPYKDQKTTDSTKFISRSTNNPFPILEYTLGDVTLRKQWFFREGKNQLLIKYTLVQSSAELMLKFNPLLNYRKVDELATANPHHNSLFGKKDNGVSYKLYANFPSTHIQCSKEITYIHQPQWLHRVEYGHDKQNKKPFSEDLYNPGCISVALNKGESIIISISTSASDTNTLRTIFETEKYKRKTITKASGFLSQAALTILPIQEKNSPHFYSLALQKTTACEALKALPGLRTALKNNPAFIATKSALISDLEKTLERKNTVSPFTQWNNPELVLWACWSFILIEKTDETSQNFYFDLLVKIIQAIRKGNIHGLRLHKNGLIGVQYTKICTPPSTKANTDKNKQEEEFSIELNAIWYNTLIHAQNYLTAGSLQEKLYEISCLCKTSFLKVFWNDSTNFLCNGENNTTYKTSFGSNSLFAIFQRYSPLNKMQQKAILDKVKSHLFTPKGLRIKSPEQPTYAQDNTNLLEKETPPEDSALPWLLGSYSDALIKVLQKESYRQLEEIEAQLKTEVINKRGYLPNAYHGSPPYNSLDDSANLLNIAEIARTLHTIKKFRKGASHDQQSLETIVFGKLYQ